MFNQIKDLNLGDRLTIYSHNLGAFDGYFILPSLFGYTTDPKNVHCLIDDSNRFILLSFKFKDSNGKDCKWTFKDSYRLFPTSLENLGKMFELAPNEMKLGMYDPKWNSIDMFKDPELLANFIEYANRDSETLLKCMDKARTFYKEKYNVDLVKPVSASSLSLLIFRTVFMLGVNIPIMSHKLDNLIRNSYFGGSTDYYKHYGENLKHYDVNSLYPHAMKNPMPLNFLGVFLPGQLDWNNIFGFVECIIKTPKELKIPLLPFKDSDGLTIHPLGIFKGTYFSEELKAVMKYGYEVEILKIYQFSKCDLFSEYVNHFFSIKRNSSGFAKAMAKLQLNSLYGIFGRKLEQLSTIISNPNEGYNIASQFFLKNEKKRNH
jgi:hypothetical protein